MVKKVVIRVTGHFEQNLATIARFLDEAGVPEAYDALLDELLGQLIPNLERFPDMGRSFLAHAAGSVEATNAIDALRGKMSRLTAAPDALREYVLGHYLVLYVRIAADVYLLSIRHHRQLSFDFPSHWGGR